MRATSTLRLALSAAAGVLVAGCGVSDEVVGPLGEPASEVAIGLTEWALVTGADGPAPGNVTVDVTNSGATAHDLVVEGEHGRWQTPVLAAGETHTLEIVVAAGEVLHLECTVPGHHSQGMHLLLQAHGAT